MKKTFALSHDKHQPARLVDLIKHDVKKYLNRERRKTLPDGADYWTFDCRFGAAQDSAEKIFTSEINKHIDAALAQQWPSFYLEILARAAQHQPRAGADGDNNV